MVINKVSTAERKKRLKTLKSNLNNAEIGSIADTINRGIRSVENYINNKKGNYETEMKIIEAGERLIRERLAKQNSEQVAERSVATEAQ